MYKRQVQVRDGGGFLNRTGVAAALAWLRLAVTPEGFARSDVMLAARRPSRGISPKVIEWIGEQSDVTGVERLAGRISDGRTADKVATLATNLRQIREFARAASSEALLEYARFETGLEHSVATLDEAHIGRNRPAHSDDLRALTALGRLHPDPGTCLLYTSLPCHQDFSQRGSSWTHSVAYRGQPVLRSVGDYGDAPAEC